VPVLPPGAVAPAARPRRTDLPAPSRQFPQFWRAAFDQGGDAARRVGCQRGHVPSPHPGAPGSQLAFVDWNMPDMTGIDFVRQVRARGDSAHVPLVMVTSEKAMSKVEEALDGAGASAYVCKPFTVDDVDLRNLVRYNAPGPGRAEEERRRRLGMGSAAEVREQPAARGAGAGGLGFGAEDISRLVSHIWYAVFPRRRAGPFPSSRPHCRRFPNLRDNAQDRCAGRPK